MKISTTRPLKIQKEQHQAVIYLLNYRVVGTVHLPVGGRFSDFINWNVNDGPFIPLTEVSVYAADQDDLLFTTDFLAVHRNNITFLTIDRKGKEDKPVVPPVPPLHR